MSIIKTVVFDIGRVLIGFEWEEYISSFLDEDTAAAVTAATFRGPYWNEFDIGRLTTEEIVNLFIQDAPEYEAEIREVIARVGQCTIRKDYAIPWIQELKGRGCQVLYLSNYSDHVIRCSEHALDFVPYTDGGIFSYRVKCIKPDEKIYKLLFEKYDLNPEECVFIDDKAENVDAAKRLGMEGIVFRNYDQAKAELDELLDGQAMNVAAGGDEADAVN